MDPRYSGQDVLHCEACETAKVLHICEICHVNLCKACIGEHIYDGYDNHKIVSYNSKKTSPKFPDCKIHDNSRCDMYCEDCDIPVCLSCIISEKHKRHGFKSLYEVFKSKQDSIKSDLDKMKNIIFPTYAFIGKDIKNRMISLMEEYEDIIQGVVKQADEWHREINIIRDIFKKQIISMRDLHLQALRVNLQDIVSTILEINEATEETQNILLSNSLSRYFISKSKKYSKVPQKLVTIKPMFVPQDINSNDLYKQFGILTKSYIKEEDEYMLQNPKDNEILQEPVLNNIINTGYKRLRSCAVGRKDEVWVSGEGSNINSFDIQGLKQKTIDTKLCKYPNDIAVTRDGDIAFSSGLSQTVYIVKNGKEEELVKFLQWHPLNICITVSGELLVVVVSTDKSQAKVLRFSGSKLLQTIQFNDNGQPLYSCGKRVKYLTENTNRDICVADSDVGAVVVVNHAGKLQFQYRGLLTGTKREFRPFGIATDGKGHILIADPNNHCVHIIDSNGQFLCILSSFLECPFGLSVSSSAELFVAEGRSGKVKIIKYLS
ncbi:E3 ubiquitin-protein ligase TRIM71-like [Saccostrea echinata]|uniref:E3 ubiquitin-protein ligase TRIM71-like n=1 Tax=Saccostrea echinata TaxID=191078 RepID=UPI002A801B6E|nr:E3 ubiquitin-protein ligase TRIM71-like [Saccostrea echinata]